MLERLRDRQEWRFFGVLPKADGPLALAWWTVIALRGVLPAGFAIAMGMLVGAVERDESLVVPLLAGGGVFLLLQVLNPILTLVSANLGDRFEHVDFAYPGTSTLVLRGVDLTIPAGAVVAVVGENGAGKTTMVKLLSKFYEPTAGRILVDGVDLSRLPAPEWRERLAGAYQDFFRFEFPARQTVGVGDVPRIESETAGGRRSAAPARATSWPSSRPGWIPNSGRRGRRASRCPSDSGRSWRWPGASCGTSHGISCSTSRRRRWTPRPSTRCSSATPPGPVTSTTTDGSRCSSRTASRPCAWPTSSS